ncbi:hypothetical protein JCM14036_30120 [Desulfotomaculum defluvii]
MKKVIIPLLGALYLGFSTLGNKVFRLLYDDDKKYGVSIEMCRPWERRQSSIQYQNRFR